jgi:ribosomal protein S18 acetylase RimI-like enzyme
MDINSLTITNILTPRQKKETARLFFKAFPKKFNTLWVFPKDEKRAVKVLSRSIRYKSGFYALSGDRVLGFIGLEKGTGYYAPISFQSLRSAFSVFSSLWRYVAYLFFRLLHGETDSDVIHIDPLVVSEQARGLGIGSSLLNKTFKYAKYLGKKKVILEVVDTNPLAKKLYERQGFRVVKEEDLSLFTKRAGFQILYYMEKDII